MADRSTMLVVAAALGLATAGPAAAQTPKSQRWEVGLTPYFWAPGIDCKDDGFACDVDLSGPIVGLPVKL